jgi:membrane-associated phospholipid phosphatase
VLVYWLWAWFIWNSDLPQRVRVVVAPLLVLWGCGVIWSRLALGAHYVTDLIGGMLLAATALALASAIRDLLRARAGARAR